MSKVAITGNASGTGTFTIASPNSNTDRTLNLPDASGTLATLETASFAAGTKLLFQQTAAPTGWTKDTTHDNKALRVVSGTVGSGGSVAFTTAFASQAVSGSVGNTTLTTAQMPSHAHNVRFVQGGTASANCIHAGGGFRGDGNGQTEAAVANGSSNSHNHTFSGTAINMAVQYVDIIIATKN